jgi:hypothetical protein
VLWAIAMTICMIVTGASRGRTHDDDGRRDPTHAALRGVSSPALIAAPGRAPGGPHALPAVPVTGADLPAPPCTPVGDAENAASRATPGLVDATSYRSRAPPLGSDLS